MEASHDLFDYGYIKGESGLDPVVHVRCPADMYNRQGLVQNPETDDIGDGTDCKVGLCFVEPPVVCNAAAGCVDPS